METHPIMRPAEMPEEFLKAVYNAGGVVCGGFARHLASSNKDSTSKDIDVYPLNKDALRNLIVVFDRISHDSGCGGISDTSLYQEVSSQTAFFQQNERTFKAQIVHMPMYPEEVLSTFDFTVCQAFLDLPRLRVITPQDWKYHEDTRLLRLTNSRRTYLAYRLTKYLDKGYSPNYETIMTFMSGMKMAPHNNDTPTAGELASWLSLVHRCLHNNNDNVSLIDQISVLGQLIDNDCFQGNGLF